ncbi:hypothetical protein [Montanilutibacter psychrotolerans]|uniref:J domain-containing protein n=1 Tax=Montanilutibacter psychrotolerans TaxID=1327343 RepID=A0A3M8SUX5_9GAMM|nr:hypothetical protein [Lysobacter psychrotolerans]RNF83276.1 hypothetical protein EER27_12350 [Lysobacter psychrotolerans]
MKPDLTLLYSQLGLKPNCSLEELQLAYRRRISELQSNREAGSTPSPESAAALRDLIGLYTTASRFQRRYGRLPGAPPRRSGSAGHSMYAAPMRVRARYAAPPSGNRPSTRSRVMLGMAVTILVLVFGLLAVASGEWLR